MSQTSNIGNRDSFRGSILGLAIGDALGYPTEFRKRDAIVEAFPPDGVETLVSIDDDRWPEHPIIVGAHQPAGTFSDDTQMSIAVAEGLLEADDDSLDTLMTSVADEFVRWSRSPENNRAPGNTCMTGCRNLESGMPWREANVANSKGCGSAMRVAPIGLYFAGDEDRLVEVARASSLLTHGHDAAVEGAAAAALLVKLALERLLPEDMYDRVMQVCGGRSPDFDRCMGKVPEMIDEDPAFVLSSDGLGEAWIAEEAVASALYCFWRNPHDFAQTVLTGANTDGDSDSIACIAGSISGAFNGIDGIRDDWVEGVEKSKALHDLADRIYDENRRHQPT